MSSLMQIHGRKYYTFMKQSQIYHSWCLALYLTEVTSHINCTLQKCFGSIRQITSCFPPASVVRGSKNPHDAATAQATNSISLQESPSAQELTRISRTSPPSTRQAESTALHHRRSFSFSASHGYQSKHTSPLPHF